VSLIESVPDSVLVTGPETLLHRLQEVATEPLSLDGRALAFEETVFVLTPNPLIQILQPSKVTVRVELEPSKSPKTGTARRKEGS
jgi:hypothetical protein